MKRRYGAILMSCFVLMTGCSATESVVDMEPVQTEPAVEQEKLAGNRNITLESEHGTLSIEGEHVVVEGAELAVFAYMEQFYESLAALELKDPGELFADPDGGDVESNRNAWLYGIGLRTASTSDLKLTGYEYTLAVEESRIQEDGSFFLCLNENSMQRFAQHPDIDSELYNIRHVFVLEQQEDAWKIRQHVQSDGVYQNLLGEYWSDEVSVLLAGISSISKTYYAVQKDALLEQSEEQIRFRESDRGTWDWRVQGWVQYPYNRSAAVAYAENWVGRRNEVWSDFTGQGGNCQNFVSQCLYAGGIPRDISGNETWSWTKADSNMAEDQVDAVPWINVEQFRRYSAENHGYGLAAVQDVPYFSGEPGDIIQMGFPQRWSHTVLVAQVITDSDGKAIDYLIHSNTADLKNFPVSAYSLPCQRLTKVLGWNAR